MEAKKLGVKTVFVAMFDEVDEGTAIFKINALPPSPIFFHEETASSDWYLYLAQEGKKLLFGDGTSLIIPSPMARSSR